MMWYEKYAGTGFISGPMTKDEALRKTDEADGMIFSENIFSPKIVTVPEVGEVIEALRVLCEWTQEDRDLNELLEEVVVVSRRAIDTLTLLSNRLLSVKPQAPEEVEQVLAEMRIASRSNITVTTRVRGILRRAVDTITLLSAKPHVPENSKFHDDNVPPEKEKP